ncbi:hypothetical protein [Candidimonas nitroreducens]|uniref:hypothetical protein n=1 Tax=Candidimonas nitroreducens TaxID=683354 RepID=UPI001177870B|nr:hypothetical protein [Candidimonas nitroreducens]
MNDDVLRRQTESEYGVAKSNGGTGQFASESAARDGVGSLDSGMALKSKGDTSNESNELKLRLPGPDSGDPTDGRQQYQWQTRYTGGTAWRQISIEAVYTVAVASLSLVLIFVVWRGYIPKWLELTASEAKVFRIYGFYTAAGLLGGTVFCLKYLYRVVARGYWHEDRRLWRFISPLIAASVAFAIGALIQSKLISFAVQSRAPGIVGTGFLIGYFGDQAVAKLHEIANVLFGTSTRSS